MGNLNSEVRADRNGKLVTRHVRTDKGSGSVARTAALSGAVPSLGTTKKVSYKKDFSEFSFSKAPRKGYVPATVEKIVEGDGWSKTEETGSKYTGYTRTAEVAKSLREDLKEAVEAGYLPDGVKYSVKASNASMTQDLTISVTGLPDSMIYNGIGKNRWGDDVRLLSDFTQELNSRLETMVNSYNHVVRNSMHDDYRYMYYSYVKIRDEEEVRWAAEQAELKRRAREDRIQKNLG